MSTGSSGAVVAGPQEHVRAVGGLRGVLDQLAAAVDPHVVVRVCLVGLQQRELRVVAEVDALVAERPAELEDPLDAADAQPLEVQLRRDAQVQVQVVGVDVGEERPGVGAAVDLLQDRRLDLQKALADQGFADGVQHTAAGPDEVARLGVDRQVDVAGAHPRLLVGQPLPLVGQRAQALADQSPAAHHQRLRALLAVAHRAGHLDQVAQIDGVREIGCGALLEQRIVKQQLSFRRTSRAAGRTARRRSRACAAPALPPSRRRRRPRAPARRCGWARAPPGTRRSRSSCRVLSLAIRTRTCSGSRG